MTKMKKRTQKVLSLLLAMVMLLGLVACGSTEEESAKPTEAAPVEAQPTEAEVAAPSWSNDDTAEITILMSGDATPNEDNLTLQEIEKRTNTKINMIFTSHADKATKLSTLIAAGDMPDLVFVNAADAIDLKEAGMLAEVGDLLQTVAPNVIKETEGLLEQVPLNNDGVYMVPNANVGHATNVVIRTDWLKNLGLEMPTDLESFAEVMHAFTYDDPDGNGVDDTFGVSLNLTTISSINTSCSNIFGAFGIAKYRPMVMEDGTVTTWLKHPNFLKAIEYIKGLIDDGVCEPDYVTIPNLSMFEKLWTGTSGCIEWEAVGPTNNWYPGRYTEDPLPTFGFTTLTGPDGQCGTAAVYQNTTQGWVFSAECENLEGAARIANFLMTEEGSDLLYLGVEGVMYNWVDKEAGTTERIGQYADDASHRAEGGCCYFQMFTPQNNAEFRTLNAQTREGSTLARENAIDWAYIPMVSTVYAEYGADMDQLTKEMVAELLTSTPVDKLQEVYDEYIAEWEAIGGAEWEEEVTQQWNDMHK